jgi:hypothetical protein
MNLKTLLASAATAVALFTAGVPLASAQTYYNYGYNTYPQYNNQNQYNSGGHIVYQNGVATWSNTSTYTYTNSGTSYYPTQYQYQTYPQYNQNQYYNYQYSNQPYQYQTYNQYPYTYNNNYGYNYNNNYNNGYQGNSSAYCNGTLYNPSGHIRYTSSGVAYWDNEPTPSNRCY